MSLLLSLSEKQCIECLKGTTCVKKVFNMCVLRRPVFGQCCTNVPDPVCLAQKEACKKTLGTLL